MSSNKSIASKYGLTWRDQEKTAKEIESYWHDLGFKQVKVKVIEEPYSWVDYEGTLHSKMMPVIRTTGLRNGVPV